MRTIIEVLDRAKQVQKVGSDYKLALTLGIGLSSLSNYRHGRSFPDEKTCEILASAMGEKPDLLMVEMQAHRTKEPQSRALWENLAHRLQSGFASVQIMGFLAIGIVAVYALFPWATLYFVSNSMFQLVYYVKSKWSKRRRLTPWYYAQL